MERSGGLRILVHLDFLGLGGHMRSATSLCRALRDRGHEVLVAGEKGPLGEAVEREGLAFHRLELGLTPIPAEPVLRPPRRRQIEDELRNIGDRFRPDIVHTFHFFNLPAARRLAVERGIPSVLTICGGDPRHSLPDPGISTILFSEEQRAFFLDRGLVDPGRVAVIPNRIEMDRWFDELRPLPPHLQRLVEAPGKKVLMTGRLAAAKSEGAVRVLDAVERLVHEDQGFTLLLVGGGDGLDTLRRRIESHRGTPLEGRVHLPGEVLRARELVPFADICVGVGRSIFEGMVCGKPCVVVGPNGYAGTIAEENVEDIARVNFSGRNAGSEVPASELASALGRLLRDEDHARAVGEFGRQWAQQNLDVREGARRYETVYEAALSRPVDDTIQAVNDYERRLRWRLRRQRLGMGLRRVWRMLSRDPGSAP